MSGGVHFHGNVSAETINNAVHGDINTTVHHGPVTHGLDPARVAELVRALRVELDAAAIPPRTRDEVHDRLDDVDRGVAGAGGPGSVRDTVRSIRDVLGDAAGAITAGGTLWTAVTALAAAVGLVL